MKKGKILTPSPFLFLFALGAVWVHGENKEAVISQLSQRVQAISYLGESEARAQYNQLNADLREVFQQAILSQPKMMQEEIDALYADYLEDNLGLFVEKDLLRMQMQRLKNPAAAGRSVSAEEVSSIQTQYQEKIQELREQSSLVVERKQ